MTLETKDAGAIRILIPHGKVVLGQGAEDLGELIKKSLSEGRKKLVVDLSKVTYMDSRGVGVLAESRKRILEKDGNGALVIPKSSSIPMVVQTCLRLLVNTFDEEDKAVGSLKR